MGISSNKNRLDYVAGNLDKLATNKFDVFLACACMTSKLKEGVDKQLCRKFSEEEGKQFCELEKRKVGLVYSIDEFVRKFRIQYVLARTLVESTTMTHNEKVEAASLLFKDTTEFDASIDDFGKHTNNLRELDYGAFKAILEQKSGITKKLVASVGATVGCIFLTSLIFAHLVHVVNVVLVAAEVSVIAAACIAAPVVLWPTLSKHEVDRATDYLSKVEKSLKTLRTSVKDMRDEYEQRRLTQNHPERCLVVLNDLMRHCDQVFEVANEVI